jgi:hypothetical protein
MRVSQKKNSINLFYKTILGSDQHEVFQDIAQIKQQHSNHPVFHTNPNIRANAHERYERDLHNNPAFHLLRRDDHDNSVDLFLNAFLGRVTNRYDRLGRNSDWNDA